MINITDSSIKHNGHPINTTESQGFDWNAIDAALGEAMPEPTEHDFKALGQSLARIFDWVLDIDLTRKAAPRLAGRRIIALAWVMDPDRFHGASMRKLAEQLGMTAPNLSKLTAAASRAFSIANKFQAHDWKKIKA